MVSAESRSWTNVVSLLATNSVAQPPSVDVKVLTHCPPFPYPETCHVPNLLAPEQRPLPVGSGILRLETAPGRSKYICAGLQRYWHETFCNLSCHLWPPFKRKAASVQSSQLSSATPASRLHIRPSISFGSPKQPCERLSLPLSVQDVRRIMTSLYSTTHLCLVGVLWCQLPPSAPTQRPNRGRDGCGMERCRASVHP
eukprot:scaffold44_cov339-Pavlova_lutheri.AAC.16